MQIVRHVTVLTVFCLTSVILRSDVTLSSLLTEEDFELESLQDGPALSSERKAKDQWQSVNEWRCFPAQTVTITCVEIDYGGWRLSPTIFAANWGHHFEYSVDPTYNWDCEFTKTEWRSVTNDSAEICFFAAPLQELGDDKSLWVLSALKSELGYWKAFQSKAYQHTKDSRNEDQNEGRMVE